MSNQATMINGSPSNSDDRNIDLKAFDETKIGVKGLVDAGSEKISNIFVVAKGGTNGLAMYSRWTLFSFNYDRLIICQIESSNT